MATAELAQDRAVPKEAETPQIELGFFTHGYQPPRLIPCPSGNTIELVSWVNERIHQKSYAPILVERKIPEAATLSFYGTLREWMKKSHPEEFRVLKQKMESLPKREDRILGDPYLHVILPFLGEGDQDTLVKIGKQAFEEDLGFTPRGFWLPETAVSSTALETLNRNGYEYVVLRDDQLESTEKNPMHVRLKNGGEMAVFHANRHWSHDVAFKGSVTVNGDEFLQNVKQNNGHGGLAMAMDMETFGEWKPERQWFIRYVADADTLKPRGLRPFDVAGRMADSDSRYTQIIENSSWSCEHQLGRWTGDCCCDKPSEKALRDKKIFFETLQNYNAQINVALDKNHPGWRADFIDFFLALRTELFSNEGGRFSLNGQSRGEEIDRLRLAKMFAFIGMTSCGWFFGEDDRPERELPKGSIEEIEYLLPGIKASA